jgi:hypothetical protein
MNSARLNAFTDRIDGIRIDDVFHTEITTSFPLERVTAAVGAALAPARTGKVMLQIGSR